MGDKDKSPMDIMLEAAYQAELKALEELEQHQAEENKPKKKRRPDFHGLVVIDGGRKD